ncbi:phage tail protein [Chitinophaga sp. Cy-1792]|uniref:phage tail protein n=1 Tax=Chitinophaga sp. Cy-1792 TaxID=2608339 RepID=UPI0014201B9C|nr:tail fiber protein [Chitinophaga sp. Cy-1792]NIG54504.1 phage tail protein [Chitinophaga sp. Cy-1792]
MATEPFLGEIMIVSFNFAPRNWALCNGQTLSIQQYAALFSLLGTTYGGDGKTTFQLPDFRGRAPVHRGTSFNAGIPTGNVANTLTNAQLPLHTHTLKGNIIMPAGNVATTTSPVASVPVSNALPAFSAGMDEQMKPVAAADLLDMNPAYTLNTGNANGYNNMMPYLVLNYVIALTGAFPNRS